MPSQSGNPPNGNLLWSDLDATQIAQRAFQEATDTYRVDISGIDPSIVIPVVQGALSVLGSFNIPFSSIHVASPYTITAGFGSPVKAVLVADTTGQTEKIAYGSSFFYTNPGCEHQIDVLIPSSTAVTIQSQELADPVAGSFIITFLG